MKISKGTIVRTIVLLIVLFNMILKAFGVNPLDIEEGTIASAVEAIVQILAIAASWWYNNSFSENAKKADEFLKQLNSSDTAEE